VFDDHEKCTADELTIPEDPPVHPEQMLNDCEPDTDDHPPQTRLLLTGLDREEITADFLVAVHDLADDHDLHVESISVGRPDRTDE
jgi:hypothetical protein